MLMQLGMAIAIAQHYISRGPHIYHRYEDGDPHIYVVLGMRSLIVYSYGNPIYIGRGPRNYEGVPISM